MNGAIVLDAHNISILCCWSDGSIVVDCELNTHVKKAITARNAYSS